MQHKCKVEISTICAFQCNTSVIKTHCSRITLQSTNKNVDYNERFTAVRNFFLTVGAVQSVNFLSGFVNEHRWDFTDEEGEGLMLKNAKSSGYFKLCKFGQLTAGDLL